MYSTSRACSGGGVHAAEHPLTPLTRTAQIRCPDRKRHWRRCRVKALRPPGSRGSRAASASRPTRAGKAVGVDPGSSADARGPARRWTACVYHRTPDAGIPATRTCDALCADGGGPALCVFNFLSLFRMETMNDPEEGSPSRGWIVSCETLGLTCS
jgi:hypothetical protein